MSKCNLDDVEAEDALHRLAAQHRHPPNPHFHVTHARSTALSSAREGRRPHSAPCKDASTQRQNHSSDKKGGKGKRRRAVANRPIIRIPSPASSTIKTVGAGTAGDASRAPRPITAPLRHASSELAASAVAEAAGAAAAPAAADSTVGPDSASGRKSAAQALDLESAGAHEPTSVSAEQNAEQNAVPLLTLNSGPQHGAHVADLVSVVNSVADDHASPVSAAVVQLSESTPTSSASDSELTAQPPLESSALESGATQNDAELWFGEAAMPFSAVAQLEPFQMSCKSCNAAHHRMHAAIAQISTLESELANLVRRREDEIRSRVEHAVHVSKQRYEDAVSNLRQLHQAAQSERVRFESERESAAVNQKQQEMQMAALREQNERMCKEFQQLKQHHRESSLQHRETTTRLRTDREFIRAWLRVIHSEREMLAGRLGKHEPLPSLTSLPPNTAFVERPAGPSAPSLPHLPPPPPPPPPPPLPRSLPPSDPSSLLHSGSPQSQLGAVSSTLVDYPSNRGSMRIVHRLPNRLVRHEAPHASAAVFPATTGNSQMILGGHAGGSNYNLNLGGNSGLATGSNYDSALSAQTTVYVSELGANPRAPADRRPPSPQSETGPQPSQVSRPSSPLKLREQVPAGPQLQPTTILSASAEPFNPRGASTYIDHNNMNINTNNDNNPSNGD
jgi:hypothetical protein